MDLARSTGAGSWRLFVKIRLPPALPDIFTGLKVGAALAATAAVVAEFVASEQGPGLPFAGVQRQPRDRDGVRGDHRVSLIGLALYYGVEFLERIAIPWHVSQRAAKEDVPWYDPARP